MYLTHGAREVRTVVFGEWFSLLSKVYFCLRKNARFAQLLQVLQGQRRKIIIFSAPLCLSRKLKFLSMRNQPSKVFGFVLVYGEVVRVNSPSENTHKNKNNTSMEYSSAWSNLDFDHEYS